MSVTIRIDTKAATAGLSALHQKQIPFALAIALNRTVEDALAVARKEMRQRFDIRVPGFDLPPVQLPKVWQATKTRPSAIFALGDSDGGRGGIGARRSRIFSKFQDGGFKSAKDPSFPIAIPTKAIRPNFSDLVPRAFYPKNLRLVPRRDVSGNLLALQKGKVRTLAGKPISNLQRRKQQLEGIGGTFTISDKETGKPIGIFQRTGPGRRDMRLIWAYRQQIHIPKRLDWTGIAQRTVATRWQPNFGGALDFAIRTAK